jgi:hypothetical protein
MTRRALLAAALALIPRSTLAEVSTDRRRRHADAHCARMAAVLARHDGRSKRARDRLADANCAEHGGVWQSAGVWAA